MSPEQQNTLEQLENYVELRLNYLKLQDDFKSLVSTVSHDLTSPLGYLKFSTDILTSQLRNESDEDLKETARVIASSTFKLSVDAKQIIDDAKLKLEKQKKSWLIKDMIVSGLKDFEIKLSKNRIIGKVEAELKTDLTLNNYLIKIILILLSEPKMEINSILIVELEKAILVRFNTWEKTPEDFKLLKRKLKIFQQKEIFKSICQYLNAEVSLKKEKSEIETRLTYSLSS